MESGKRKYEADVVNNDDGASNIPSEKRSKFSHENALNTTLLDLSDDVLILILRLLSSHDLLNLSDVCERFDRITADETLWKIVDTRESPIKVILVIFYTEILTRKVVLWCFFTSETSEKIHNSTFRVKISV